MDSRIPSHDDFVRSILADIEIATAYFKSYLPGFVVEKLDFSTLTQSPETYLSEELKKSISDIVYSCKLRSKKGNIKISLLIEHKSTYDKKTIVQIGSYIFSAFQKQIQNKESLSLVIPVLLYHGQRNWKYQTLQDLFASLDDDLKLYLPSFDYVFNNLGLLSDREIESLNNKFLAASFLALKHTFDKQWLETNAERLFILASPGETGLEKSLILYVFSRGKLPENVLNSLPEPIKREVMNTFDVYFEKGVKKGREEGMEKGMEKGKIEEVRNLIMKLGFTNEQAAEVAEVSVSFVRKVRVSLKKK
ncbi:MAG: Rpn family recombination-promoting nuclease/putative transposase [Chitinophagaceae bacterium]|nr:Rpn family recombination-promoting nuclease/putative transposase [Chitinophagaceae bacterium]